MPAILFFFVYSYLPMPGIYIAFTNFNYAKGLFGSQFVGLNNFEFLITSGKISMLTRNTILYNLAFIILGNVLQIFVAILLNEILSKRFKKITQTMMFLPYFISAVLVGLLLYNLLNFDYGFINSIIEQFGGTPIKVYSNKHVWPYIIVAADLWQRTGYGSIVYFAAIMGIDSEMIEAAKVDGVNAFQKIRFIILPNLRPTIVILLLFAMGGILKGNFGLFYNIIGASNSLLFPTTDIIETFVFRSMMNNFNFTQASAVGLYQSLFGFALVMTCNWIVKRIDSDYALF
jgi:putative aldouronate transport system permease protein